MTRMPQKPAVPGGPRGQRRAARLGRSRSRRCAWLRPCEPLSPQSRGRGWGACEGDKSRPTPGSVHLGAAVSLTLLLPAADNGELLLRWARCSHASRHGQGTPGILDLGLDPHPELNFLSVTYRLTKRPEDSVSEPHLARPGVSIHLPQQIPRDTHPGPGVWQGPGDRPPSPPPCGGAAWSPGQLLTL